MSLQCKCVVKSIGTGAAGTSIVVTGAGFQPKAMFCFATSRVDTVDAQGQESGIRSMGFGANCNGTIKQRSVGSFSTHNAVTGSRNEYARNHSDKILIAQSGSSFGQTNGDAALTAFTSDGCTLTVGTQFVGSLRVIFIFFGGSDLTDIQIGTITPPATGTAPFNTDITGLGFNPVLGQAAGFLLYNTHNVDNSPGTDSDIGVGAFVRATEQACLVSGANSDPAANTQCESFCSDVRSLTMFNPNVAAVTRRMQFVQWLTDGFRLQNDEVTSEQDLIYYMILNGGKWAVKPLATATTGADVAITDLGFQPVGGLVFSAMQTETADDNAGDNMGWSVGIFDSPSSRYAVAQFQQDNLATSLVADAIQHDEVYINVNQTGAIQGLMDVNSLDSNGVTFHMDDADPSVCFAFTVLGGSTTGGGGGGGTPGTLSKQLIIPTTVLPGQDIYVCAMSKGHTVSFNDLVVVDNDTTGNTWQLVGKSVDGKAEIFIKRATAQTGGRTVTVSGGVTGLSLALVSFGKTKPGVLTQFTGLVVFTDFLVVTPASGAFSIAGFTPTNTDSHIVAVVFNSHNSPVTSLSGVTLGNLTKRAEDLTTDGGGAGVSIWSAESDGGPTAVGNIAWSSASGATYVARFALVPDLGNGSSWTTKTKVDAAGEQTSAERMLFGGDGSVTYAISETDRLRVGGYGVLGVLGEPDQFITVDRVYLTCTATVASEVAISLTADGGATWSNEVLIEVSPSNNGVFTGTGWNISTLTQFQPRIRIVSGDVTVHEGMFYVQPHGRAA